MNTQLNIIYKKTADLIPYANNPRDNDAAVEYVANSIQEFGFKVPLVIDSNNVIVAGHTRLKACERLGIEEVPCIIADDLTPEQIKAFRLADNKVGEIATWDLDKLMTELQDIDLSMDMSRFGFDEMDTGDVQDIQEDNYEVNLPAEPKTKLGEIYQLGRHRLFVGDATEAASYTALMAGATADLLLTDPPYNVALGHADLPDVARQRHRRTDGLIIMNDKMTDGQFYEFLCKFYTAAFEHIKAGGSFYIWHADNESLVFRKALEDCGITRRQTLVWVKNAFSLGRNDYQWRHEPCLYGWKDGAAHYFTNSRCETTVIDDTPNFDKMKKDEAIALLKEIYSREATTILYENKPTASPLHPTMKPLPLMGYLIQNSSKPKETVLDPFGGSGSTLIACEQLNRICFTMELDPQYADVIIDRWEKFTGNKAVKQ